MSSVSFLTYILVCFTLDFLLILVIFSCVTRVCVFSALAICFNDTTINKL